MKLADACIRRPVFAVMLVGSLVVMGLVAMPRLPAELFPRAEYPLITVSTVIEGASPQTVEREVTEVIEEAVNTIEGIEMLSCTSTESYSGCFIQFSLEYDVHEKAQEVRSKVYAAQGSLPRDAESPVIERLDPDAMPVMAILLSGPQSIRALTEIAERGIKRRLERIKGVGNVEVVGGRSREIRIWLDPLKLAGWGIAIDEILAAIRREHLDLPGGRIETDRREYVIRTQGKFAAAEQFGGLIVAERQGRRVYLRDVALVEDGMAEARTIARLNGRRGVALLVRRQTGENTIRVVDAVREVLEEVRPTLPPGSELLVSRDQSRFIRGSIHDVIVDLSWGALLAVLVVLAFLRSARSTLITGIAIPSSLIGTFTFFHFFGFNITFLNLMGLSLSIGMLIDDAIVVLENIYRHMERGEEPMVAASKGTQEIGLAVVATTLSICAVFVPIAFMTGLMGEWFHEFGLVVTCAVLTSLLVAFTVTPMLCSRYLRIEQGHGRAWHAMERRYRSIENGYRRLLGWGLRHRPTVVTGALVVVAAGVLIAGTIPIDFIIADDRSEFNVWLKMPVGTPIARTLEATSAVEEALRSHPEVRTVFSTVGGGAKKRVNEANVFVGLTHKLQRDLEQHEIMRQLRERIAALDLPLTDFAVEDLPWVSMPGARAEQLAYSVRGPDTEVLAQYASALIERMRAAGGYVDIASSHETGKPEIQLEIDRERAAQVGIPAAQIGQTVLALFSDYKVATFEEGGERYDVRTRVRPEYRDDPLELELVYVRSPSGSLVNLSDLVVPRMVEGPVQIDRQNRTRAVTIYANLDGKGLGPAFEELDRFAEELGIGGAYQTAPVGAGRHLQETVDAVILAFALALTAIYIVLASQFNSFVHPFTIMLSAPLSFIGAFATLALLGHHLDMMGQIGFLMLMGLVMKNGILLVDYTNTLRERGRGLREAVLEAAPTRLRPVLMTTISTICGMIPVAFSEADGAEWRSPMGVIAIGGLTTSMVLTLLVVPVVYTLLDDAQSAAARGLAWLRDAPSRFGGRRLPRPQLGSTRK